MAAIGTRGFSSTWRDRANGQSFEVQLYIPESWAAKSSTHELYEQQRPLPEGSPAYAQGEERMKEIFAGVPTPPAAREVGRGTP